MVPVKGMLSICGALAAGEYLASFVPSAADVWPAVAGLAVLIALFGFGLAVRGWPLAFFCILGIALFLCASTADERLYREKPWMRGRLNRDRRTCQRQTGIVRELKGDLSRRIAIGLADGSETVDLSRAILLGERRRLTPQVKRTFVESGTMHVFAISGLHVMAVAEVLTYLLALLLVPRRLVGVAAVPLLWGYVWLIGFSPSAVRAASMATFSCLAPLFWRKPDGLRSWALTFLTVHLLDPQMIVNVGSVLSFAVMLAIVLVGNWVRNFPKGAGTLAVTVAAWAVGVPIAAHVFGRITPGGMLANLVLIATARITVVTGAVGMLASYLSEALAAHLNNLSALTVRMMVWAADAVSRLPGANYETARWTLPECAAWYAALVLVACLLRRLVGRRKVI